MGFVTMHDPIFQVSMTGKERFPIVGNKVPENIIYEALEKCTGLQRNWGCLEKAVIAYSTLSDYNIPGDFTVVLGETSIFSSKFESSIDYFFNPPYEFHAWVQFSAGEILDIALPGVIEVGLLSGDEIGPYLVEREICILNGTTLQWMRYVPIEFLTDLDVKQILHRIVSS